MSNIIAGYLMLVVLFGGIFYFCYRTVGIAGALFIFIATGILVAYVCLAVRLIYP